MNEDKNTIKISPDDPNFTEMFDKLDKISDNDFSDEEVK